MDGTAIGAGRLIVATGTKPVVPPIEGLADGPFLTSEMVWDLTRAAASLLVLGVEAAARLLGQEEPAASEVIARVFKRDGIELRLGAKAVRVRYPAPDTVRVELDDGSILDAQHLLVAVGRTPVTEGLGLESAGVGRDERGFIRTDERMATSAPGVFAAGDVTGRLLFTHAADEMGRIAGNALRWPMRRRFRAESKPWVIFTRPEVARVGLTEAETAGRGGRIAYLPMTEVDRAIAVGVTDGFVTTRSLLWPSC